MLWTKLLVAVIVMAMVSAEQEGTTALDMTNSSTTKPTDPELQLWSHLEKRSLLWPRGNYALVKTQSGCPEGWASDGRRHWDTEDSDSNTAAWPCNHHFRGAIDVNVELNFCVKKTTTSDLLAPEFWPSGQYCLLKFRACPTGFTVGKIHWDDEDDTPQGNTATGTLPDGVYGTDTDMEFCCRSDGDTSVPISLPTRKPFYLIMASRNGCQTVADMNLMEEYVHWDTEDDNNSDSSSGTVPYNGGGSRNWRFFFCYYYK